MIRPGIYQDAMHLAWDVYYRDRGSPRVIPFDAIRFGLADCDRIWFIWDKTWWMNSSERQRTRTLEAISALRRNFDQVEHDAHRDLELRLMRKRTR